MQKIKSKSKKPIDSVEKVPTKEKVIEDEVIEDETAVEKVPLENRKDIEEINEDFISGLSFIYVDKMMDVLNHALLKEKVKNPLKVQ